MLVLSRKKDEEIYIETTIGNIILKIVDIDEKNVKVGITAPKNMPIYRCLLYTSPSPRDRTRYRMPSSA